MQQWLCMTDLYKLLRSVFHVTNQYFPYQQAFVVVAITASLKKDVLQK